MVSRHELQAQHDQHDQHDQHGLHGSPHSATDPVEGNAESVPQAWARRLTHALDARALLLRDLEATAARQDAAIGRRDAAELMSVLAGRQSVVDRFMAGQPELLELTSTFAERIEALPRAEADELRGRMRLVSEGLARIAEHDELARAALVAAREETRIDLERMNAGAGARAAYQHQKGLQQGPTQGLAQGPRSVFADRRA